MSYFASHTAPSGLGDVPVLDWYKRLKGVVKQGEGLLDMSEALVADPYLPETVCRVMQLSDIEAGKDPRPCEETPPGRTGGIGLRNTIGALRTYVWAVDHPALAVATGSALVGSVFLMGYLYGRL